MSTRWVIQRASETATDPPSFLKKSLIFDTDSDLPSSREKIVGSEASRSRPSFPPEDWLDTKVCWISCVLSTSSSTSTSPDVHIRGLNSISGSWGSELGWHSNIYWHQVEMLNIYRGRTDQNYPELQSSSYRRTWPSRWRWRSRRWGRSSRHCSGRWRWRSGSGCRGQCGPGRAWGCPWGDHSRDTPRQHFDTARSSGHSRDREWRPQPSNYIEIFADLLVKYACTFVVMNKNFKYRRTFNIIYKTFELCALLNFLNRNLRLAPEV